MKNQNKTLEELKKKDKKLIKVLDSKKKCPFFLSPIIKEEVLFYELAQSIIGQQISAKAANSIWKELLRFLAIKKIF